MQKPEVVLDSSCILALDAISVLPKLAFLFSRVLLPKAVRRELFRRRATKNRIRTLLREYAFIARCDDYDQTAVDVLLAERRVRGQKDRGEAESVIQASKRAAAIVIDDPWGRKLAERFSLQFGGTIWILQRFHTVGLRSAFQVRSDFATLLQRNFRLPREAINAFLKEIGQEPIKPSGGG
jgi:predicted nucleic acid-binding protein